MKRFYFATMMLFCLFLVGCKPEPEIPTVVTEEFSEITANTAKVVYIVEADGGAEVTSRGVCWSTSNDPTIDDEKTEDGTGLGTFTSVIENLTPSTTYFVRAYAVNSAGVAYGEGMGFVTLKEDDGNGGDDNGDDDNGGDDNGGDDNGGDDNGGDDNGGDDNGGDDNGGDDNGGDDNGGDDNGGDDNGGDDNGGDDNGGDDNGGDDNGGDDNGGDDNGGDDNGGENVEPLTVTVNGVSFTMIAVQSGTFNMGAQKDDPNAPNYDEEAWSREAPVHEVTLSNYYIGETEVTQELWKAVMGYNPSHFEGDQRPVEQVTWYNCQEFISKLNQLTGMNFRLPTEAEWEFAAKGGNESQSYKYSGSDNINDVAWYSGDDKKTHDVKTKAPNELGIYDMSGNVMEWNKDLFGDYSSEPQIDPTGAASGTDYIIRGGCCLSAAEYCRMTIRSFLNPGGTSYGIGLRLAISL